MELLIGCGSCREKRLVAGRRGWTGLVTLDIDPGRKPDVVHDLRIVPLPFEDNSADEIHAYHVLEHTGAQGDYEFFFRQFSDFWRILKPGGHFMGIVPVWADKWAWSEPGHTRVISDGTLLFLSQKEYVKEIGVTTMTDYRSIYKADFDIVFSEIREGQYVFILQAVK